VRRLGTPSTIWGPCPVWRNAPKLMSGDFRGGKRRRGKGADSGKDKRGVKRVQEWDSGETHQRGSKTRKKEKKKSKIGPPKNEGKTKNNEQKRGVNSAHWSSPPNRGKEGGRSPDKKNQLQPGAAEGEASWAKGGKDAGASP